MRRMHVLLLALTVAAAPVDAHAQLASLVVDPAATGCAQLASVRASISVPAPAGGTVVQLASSVPATFPVPASVTIPQGASTATVTVRCVPAMQPLAVTVTATAGASRQVAIVNVLAPAMRTISVKGLEVDLGSNTIVDTAYVGAFTLEAVAPASGVIVTFTAAPALVTIEPTITVPAGATSGRYTVTALKPVAQPTVVTLTATAVGVSRTTSITLQPPVPLSLQDDRLVPVTNQTISASGGQRLEYVVQMSGIAPATGSLVNLTSSNGAVASVPGSVVLPPGARTTSFFVTAAPQASAAVARISATVGAVSRSVSIAVAPTTLALLTFNAASTIIGGQPARGTIGLSTPAPSGGMLVQLASSSAALVVPASVTIPAGSRLLDVPMSSRNVSTNVPVTVTASAGAISKSASIVLAAEGISDFSMSPTSVVGGTSSSGRLQAPTGHDGFTVSLASSSVNVIVPASVTFAANETSKTFVITTKGVTGAQTARITATARSNVSLSTDISSTSLSSPTTVDRTIDPTSLTVPVGTSTSVRAADIQLVPPTVTALTLSATSVVGGSSTLVTGTIRLSGPAAVGLPVNVRFDRDALVAFETAPVITAGSSIVTFTLRTRAVTSMENVGVSARVGEGLNAAATLSVRPP